MNNECDILYICGTLEYGGSVSGNYILYKTLKRINGITLKVLPVYSWNSDKEESEHFLSNSRGAIHNLSSEELISRLPKHKVLFLSGDDMTHQQIYDVCNHFNSKFVTITMSHWIFGNTSHYPELDNDFDGENVRIRANLYHMLDTHIIAGSSNSKFILENSLFKNIPCTIIPFPFEEVDVYSGEVVRNQKSILWGTQQPDNPRKGKAYFEKALEFLYNICDTPDDIVIRQIGPKSPLNTKFKVEWLGEIENRVELSKVYKSSKVFALSTLADAGPMMALECIKNETPLVSFRTNISTDLVDNGKNGYITNSVEEYAEHLYSILYNDKFHMDYEYVKTFNSESSVDIKYQNFFNTLLNK
tara:strand:- start:64 stop:1140 length:1077 start_codon:yes stop_codon:yes gene_type:complete